VELPTGFVETEANGFHIITRPAYFNFSRELAQRDPEALLEGGPANAATGPMEGRGRRLEMPGAGGETIILKRQRRGGLYRRFMGDIYKDDYQSVSEVFLSETAWKKGVPVALLAFAMSAPAGQGRLASYRRAYVGSIKLEGARTLMEWLSIDLPAAQRRAVLIAAAHAVNRAHDRGFKHGDLNLGNILVVKSAQGEYGGWLIDLQHSEMGGSLRFEPRLENLVRLYRSAEKWLPDTRGAASRSRDIVRFLRAYTLGEAGGVRRYLEGGARHRASIFFHRLGWRVTGAGRVTRRSSVPTTR